MIVVLSASAAPRITDADRVDRLHAERTGPLAEMQLEPVCRPADAGHVWVAIAALRAAVEPVAGVEAFDGMLRYAAAAGWLDDDADHVRAHVVETG